jgi:hypothetical protein
MDQINLLKNGIKGTSNGILVTAGAFAAGWQELASTL